MGSSKPVRDDVRARAGAYAMLSAGFHEPSPRFFRPEEFDALFQRLPEAGRVPLPPPGPQDPAAEMRRVFGHNLSPDCPPYETQYGKLGVFRKTQVLADLSGFYRAFGLGVTDGDRRPDHLPVELEFASLLCWKEFLAEERRLDEKVSLCRNARARFVGEHLAVWTPVFAEAVARKAPDNYYAGLTKTLAVFVALDAKLLGSPAPAATPAGLLREEAKDPCQSCFGTPL